MAQNRCVTLFGRVLNRKKCLWDRSFNHCGNFLIEIPAARATSERTLVSESENNRSKRCFFGLFAAAAAGQLCVLCVSLIKVPFFAGAAAAADFQPNPWKNGDEVFRSCSWNRNRPDSRPELRNFFWTPAFVPGEDDLVPTRRASRVKRFGEKVSVFVSAKKWTSTKFWKARSIWRSPGLTFLSQHLNTEILFQLISQCCILSSWACFDIQHAVGVSCSRLSRLQRSL